MMNDVLTVHFSSPWTALFHSWAPVADATAGA
jgi:hypothetical protein